MLEAINGHYQLIALILMSLVLVVAAYCVLWLLTLHNDFVVLSRQLSAIHQESNAMAKSLDAIQQQVVHISNENSDLHALAAHFVGYKRTKNDVSRAHYFDEEAGYGADPAGEFYRDLK